MTMTQPDPQGVPAAPVVSAAPAAPAAPPTYPALPTPPAAPAPAPVAQPFDPASLPAEAQAYIRSQIAQASAAAEAKHRTESKANAAEAARKEMLAQMSQALGLSAPPADPTQLTQTLQQRDAELRQLRVERLVEQVVPAGANGQLILAMLAYQRQLDGIDPTAPDARERAGQLVAAAIAANPTLGGQPAPVAPAAPGQPGYVPPAPAASGAVGNMAGGAGAPAITREQLAQLSPSERVKAFESGQLTHLL